MDTATWYTITALSMFNLIASAMALRNDGCSPEARRRQVLFIWLLPVIGAVLVLAFRELLRAPGTGQGGRLEEDWAEEADTLWTRIDDYVNHLIHGADGLDASCSSDSASGGDCGGGDGGGD